MLGIFLLSAQPAKESSKTSGTAIETVAKLIYPEFNDMTKEEQAKFIEKYQNFARKTAHFTIYGVLGVLSILSFVTYEKPPLAIRSLISFAIGSAYAVFDEYHQSLVPGRSGELRDVILDSAGVLCGVIAVTFIASLVLNKKTLKELDKLSYTVETNEISYNERIIRLENDIARLKRENLKLQSEITQLNAKKIEAPSEEVIKEKSEPLKNLENRMVQSAELPDDTKMGAEFIGKIVVKAAMYCNEISTSQNPNSKELVNLILGRSEVAKAEILEIVSSEAAPEIKRTLMESKQKEAEDYFLSIKGQIM